MLVGLQLLPLFSTKTCSFQPAWREGPFHLPRPQTLVLEGALPAEPRLGLTLLTTPKASDFSEAVFMTTYKLDTDCLICIGARHRDAQNLAGMPRHGGGLVLQQGVVGAHVRAPVRIAAGRAKGVYRNPENFRSKL